MKWPFDPKSKTMSTNNNNNVCDVVIFGGHGDLAMRKLMPALYHLCNNGFLDAGSRIISTTLSDMTQEEHLELVKTKLNEFLAEGEFDENVWANFSKRLSCVKVDVTQKEEYAQLEALLNRMPDNERVYYLSTSSSLFGTICHMLQEWNLVNDKSRVVLEKPIGRDLESSRKINDAVAEVFDESCIYRIDHYLGKDTVQNILALRFSNGLFMPLWSSRSIDHVQITVFEEVGVEGRWGYYDDYGALRDMIQNHLLQLLCLVAMEPPCSIDSNSVRDEKVKVLRSLRKIGAEDIPLKTVRGQYGEGVSQGKSVPGYLNEENVKRESNTETFAALRIDIDNWRWNKVPFYVRTGKRMRKRYSEIVIQFKDVPHMIFPRGGHCIEPNKLIIKLQPEESIKLVIMNKIPGLDESIRLRPVELELNIPEDAQRNPTAYERLLLDVIRANPTLFMRRDEVEAAWIWADEILRNWERLGVKCRSYAAGTDGPSSSIALIERDGRSWHEE